MPLFTISNFATLAKLMVATRKILTEEDPLNRFKAMTDLATNAKSLKGALNDRKMTKLATMLEKTAQNADAAFAHAGPNKTNAQRIFWQVVPIAIEDPKILVDADLSYLAATDAMVAKIKVEDTAEDFTREPLAATYFRKVMQPVLKQLLDDPAFVDGLAPELRRRSRQDERATRDTSERTMAMVETLLQRTEGAVPKKTLLSIVHTFAPDAQTKDHILANLNYAAQLAVDRKAQDAADDRRAKVKQLLSGLANLRDDGHLEKAAAAATDAVESYRSEHPDDVTGISALLSAAVDYHILIDDLDPATRYLLEQADLGGPAASFDTLRQVYLHWYERGRDRSIPIMLHLSGTIAMEMFERAGNDADRGMAMNDLGNACAVAGSRDPTLSFLDNAIIGFERAIRYRNQPDHELAWAESQMNLGHASSQKARRTRDKQTIETAGKAYMAALSVFCADQDPVDWTIAVLGMGNLFVLIGSIGQDHESLATGCDYLDKARDHLSPDDYPEIWATAHLDYGAALSQLGALTDNQTCLINAASMLRLALQRLDKRDTPYPWAKSQLNLGNAQAELARMAGGADRLEAATDAYLKAAEVLTPEADPRGWIELQSNFARLHLYYFDQDQVATNLEEAEAYLTAIEDALDGEIAQELAQKIAATRQDIQDRRIEKQD
ncbi:hypothetical protein [Actibacterium sp. 188UL27-1]|uniref:hypothetical protein n=1 Tax=Actibacterium sp. 188UL27-1 TaxID=2786961 RepID=UPI0019582BE1|nr:hypothetical protein [Actibacterium sp. 188UL27-1]MBM7070147.1 hypothetical protein [Actibacterium sp. 188UL27-1]